MVETRRHDVKLDSFLRRAVAQEDYERVCCSEPCVIVSPEEKRVHRHAVLGHRSLFTTEVPPKNLRVVLRLEDLISIKVLEDLPEFLSGEEQSNTMHIQLHYKRPAKERRRFGSLRSKKSPVVPKKKSTNTRRESEEGEGGAAAAAAAAATSTELPRLSPGIGRKSPQLTPSPPQLVIAGRLSPTTSARTSPVYRTSPDRTSPGTAFAARSNLEITHHTGSDSSGHRCLSAELYRESDLQEIPVALFQKKKPAAESSGRMFGGSSLKLLAVPGTSTGDLSYRNRTASQPDLYRHGGGSTSPLLSTRDHFNRSCSSETLSSSMEGGSEMLEFLAQASKMEVVVVDLYLLTSMTDFYHQLKVSWEDVKINQVLNIKNDSPGSSSPKQERFWYLFSTLKNQFLTARELARSAELAEELSTASQKYFIIKKMFWEDSDLLSFCTRQLQQCLSASKQDSRKLEDNIEYGIVLMNTLYHALRETHIVRKKKLICLVSNSGLPLLTLARAIVWNFPSPSLRIDNAQRSEFTEKTCGVMYELFQAVEQARWPMAHRTNVSTSWLVENLISSNEADNFFRGMIEYLTQIIISRDSMMVTPEAHVTLYHIAVLILTFLKTSPPLVQQFRKEFTEEFKYYINLHKVQQRLVNDYFLTKEMLDILQACKLKIIPSNK